MTHYERLEIAPTASADEVKHAFRQQIARYHPDKVHHLGREFQELAATRAAELTEAYQTLSRAERRRAYDATLAPAHAPASAAAAARTRESAPRHEPRDGASAPDSRPPVDLFASDRAGRDILLRRACLDRLRRALARLDGGYAEATVRGFDVAYVPRPKLFGRRSGPRLLGRLVPRVDAASVAEVLSAARRWDVPASEEVSVILMGTTVAPEAELSAAVDTDRRRPSRGGRLSLTTVDASHWEVRLPADAPAVVRTLAQHLRTP